MNIFNKFFVSITVICFMGLMPMTVVWSADEDMISQVYLEFDPETGDFVTAQDPSLTGTSKHSIAQSKQVEQIQQAQDKLAAGDSSAAQPGADTMAAAPAGQQGMAADDAAGSSSLNILIAGIVALGLLVGIVAFVRKNQQTT